MRIVIIGTGNIAHFFTSRLYESGNEILQIVTRSADKGVALTASVNATLINDISKITKSADVYILAVNDNEIENVANDLMVEDKIVVHCAGSLPIDILNTSSRHNAVVWPIYSIKKDHLPKEKNIPLIIEASDEYTLDTVKPLAQSISTNVTTANFTQRQILHLNAVIANNFTNHLLSITEQLCNEHNLNFELLLPIIHQTFEQIKSHSPSSSQTGPAIRHDENTIRNQENLLNAHPLWQEIYKVITQSIQNNPTK